MKKYYRYKNIVPDKIAAVYPALSEACDRQRLCCD